MKQGGARRAAVVWALRVVVVACVAAMALLPPLSVLIKTTDTARIDDFHVKMNLSADGTLLSREVIDVVTPYGKHGIFRIFDLKDPRRRGVDHPVSQVEVTRDGRMEPWVWEKESSRSRTAKIGSASVLLDSGIHRYVITSKTVDVLEPGKDGEAVWWWDVIGSGWQMTMQRASVTARLPATPKSVRCVMGDSDPCEATVNGRLLRVNVGPLDTHTPVTVKVTFPKGAVPAPPAGDGWLKVWSAVIAAVIAAALLGAYLYSVTRERPPGFPVLFEPPAGVGPAVGAKVLYEDDSNAAMQATLYDLAERGVLRLEGDDDSWRIHAVQEPGGVEGVTAGELAMLNDLGLRAAGDSFLVSESKTAGEKVANAQTALESAVGAEAGQYLTTTPAGVVAKVCCGLGLAAIFGAACAYFFADWSFPWPLISFVATFTVATLGILLDPAAGSKHTPEGVELWSRTGGFARFLTTDSSESRFDAAAHLDWYQRYLPWAVAFGAADQWAKRYEMQGVTTPDVPWMIWGGTGHSMGFASMGDALTSSISSAVSSYEASQSSSGGGGFSGGSGGGGGGGGSW